ncbi:MAG: hypothetical protein F6K18_05400 [Okeania sp. SIO2C2]|uniref:hypothetical protein n=1 Tax=Okeania sp. SIO2C2 TaxID=2607787 RepID=UPI0013BBF5B7|nr:hypothetical protein [Okeania sp. SIO2C2]NEP86302.1 hypothetical protein [Okeania sp. SIO2C2]
MVKEAPGLWGDGEMGRWGDGEMGRWGDGEMGRWGVWGAPGVWEKLKNILYILIITMQDYRTRKSK